MSFVGRWYGFGKSVYYDAAIRAHEKGDLEGAVEQFRLCLAHDHDPAIKQSASRYLAGCLGRIAASLMAQENPEAAAERLTEALEQQPGFADLHLAMAKAQRFLGSTSLEREHLEEALHLNPNYALALVHHGALMYESGDIKQGLRRVEEGLRRMPSLKGLVWQQALEESQAGRHAQAVAKILSIRPAPAADAQSLILAGDDAAKERMWADALTNYRSAMEMEPRWADLQCRMGQALMELDDLPEAEKRLRESVLINPNYAEAHALLGVCLRRQGAEEEAKSCFRRALEIDPNQPIAVIEIMRPV